VCYESEIWNALNTFNWYLKFFITSHRGDTGIALLRILIDTLKENIKNKEW